jgi:1-acyl-sn-glycerol-3-phosphate acyltransferase
MIAAARSLLFVLWLTITVVPWALAVMLASIVIRGRPLYWMCVGWVAVAIWGARVICGVRWRVAGMDNLPTAADHDASVVLAPKHQSTWETFAFPMLMPHPLAYVFKRELLYIPFFGWAMSRLDMVHIDRSRRAEAWAKVMAQGRELMAHGTWLIMFPEGTRVARGAEGDYKLGAARLAVASGVAIVPIAVTSGRCWPRKSFLLRPGVIDVSIGPPMASVGRRPDALMADVRGWIEAEMRRLDPDAYNGAEATAPAVRLGRAGPGGRA